MCFELLCCFFKQKTAYEMRISDWSSDVCSSDLHRHSATDCAGHHANVRFPFHHLVAGMKVWALVAFEPISHLDGGVNHLGIGHLGAVRQRAQLAPAEGALQSTDRQLAADLIGTVSRAHGAVRLRLQHYANTLPKRRR